MRRIREEVSAVGVRRVSKGGKKGTNTERKRSEKGRTRRLMERRKEETTKKRSKS